MRAFLSLVDKEWRDARALVLLFTACVPLAIYASESVFMHWRRPEVSSTVLGGLIVLFVAVMCVPRSGTGALRIFRVRFDELGIDREIASYSWVSLTTRRGSILFQPDEDRFVHRDLTTGEDLVQIPVQGVAHVSVLTKSTLAVNERQAGGTSVSRIVDATTGDTLYGPFEPQGTGWMRAGFQPRPAAGAWVYLHRANSTTHDLLNVSTGARRSGRACDYCWDLAPAAVIPGLGTAFAEGPRIIVLDDDGNVIRTYLDAE